VNFCESQYQNHLALINDYDPIEKLEITYKDIKESLKEMNHNSWSSSMYVYESFSLEVTKHDSNSPSWLNEQHGGF